jgi:hypothetical protein
VFQLQGTFPSEIWLTQDLQEARTENFPEIPIGFRIQEKLLEMPELLFSSLPVKIFKHVTTLPEKLEHFIFLLLYCFEKNA